MRILADENIQDRTVDFLRERGWDVEDVRSGPLRSQPDDVIFEHAQDEERCILTFDADFSNIRELASRTHCGIIRLRVTNQRTTNLHPILIAALEQLKKQDMTNMLVTIGEERVRLRHTLQAR